MYHLWVSTMSGATYLFRIFNDVGRVYATSFNSSSGRDLRNHIVETLDVSVGERMHLRDGYGPVVSTSRVISWVLEPIVGPGPLVSDGDTDEGRLWAEPFAAYPAFA